MFVVVLVKYALALDCGIGLLHWFVICRFMIACYCWVMVVCRLLCGATVASFALFWLF